MRTLESANKGPVTGMLTKAGQSGIKVFRTVVT